jgi:PKD repeat protein
LPNHYYTTPGTYTVKVIGCNDLGCDSLTRTDYVTIYPKPAQPVIVENAGTLSTSVVAPFYQWYCYGQEIVGATTSSYTPATTASGSGLYKVIAKTDKGCTNASADYSYYPVRAVFSSDTSSFCGVNNATVHFYNASTNTSNYTWDFGDGTTSTDEWPIHMYSAPGFYTVKLKACGAVTCDSLIQTNYIRIYATPFTTSVIPQGYTILCNNTNDTVVLKAQTLAGATYKWQIGGNDLSSTDSLFVVHTWSAGYYNSVVTDKMGTGCIASSPFVHVDIDYNCVWPGDANNDHVVDYLDLLPIGLYYGESGTSRYTISELWKGYSSFSWGNGGDLNHSDCNGDGTINYTDTMAIHKNLTLTHTFTAPVQEKKQNSTAPAIYFKTASTTYLPGTWVTVDIIAGDANVPVGVLYGIAFMINYDQSLIEPGTASINFSPGWFIQNNSSLTFSNIEAIPNTAYIAATAIDHKNKAGYGKIATLCFKTSNTIGQSSNLKFVIGGLKTIDATGAPLLIYPQDYTIKIDPVITGIDQLDVATNISVYPNPYLDKTTIAYSLNKKSSVSLEVYSVFGQKLETLINKEQAAGEYKLSFSAKEKGYSEGVYFIKITIDGKVSLKRIVEL